MTIRVGIPRALMYYEYGDVWQKFLTSLGAEVVVSGISSKQTLDYGSALDEICLPAKIYFGHVCELYQNVDYLFVPRIVSVAKGQYTCPKIIGMPDLLRCNIKDLPPLIDFDINLRQSSRSLFEAIVKAGQLFGKNTVASLYAWYQAWKCYRRQQADNSTSAIKVALIGHPYVTQDSLISMNAIEKLTQAGIGVVTPEMVSPVKAETAARALGKKIFWSCSHHMTGAALALMQAAKPVAGVIFLTTFSCGPDALVAEIIGQQAQARGIPYMTLSVDEHTAEAGFVTRIEAFTDMLTRRCAI